MQPTTVIVAELMEHHGLVRVIEHIMQLPDERKMVTAALLWCWWTEHSKENHNEKQLSAAVFQFLIKRHTYEWEQFFKPKSQSDPRPIPRWTPPSENFIMLNTDGTFLECNLMGGWGDVA
jgi:hypothetical protein